jgi:CheY-like chemotaxis protein/anti-sigma regulatory factor (Ser/Thr protein kinase)
LCENLVALFQPKAQAKGVRLGYALEPGAPERILSDPQRLRQILLNLVGNAVKFTNQGTVTLRVMATDDGASIAFEVEDSGTGIPLGKIPMLFDPFVQADSSTTRQFGGSGLGLAIVSRFVVAMQGSIEVKSTVGEGSVFRVLLPLEVPETIADEPADTSDASAEEVKIPKGLRILLAEDNSVNQMVFQRMLLRLGCEVLTAKNGQEALEIVSEKHVDLILMDCQMPVLDGLEATKELRGMGGKFVTLPVIAITASAMNEDREQCFAAGMNDFLSKPLIFASLEEKIVQWCKVAPPV